MAERSEDQKFEFGTEEWLDMLGEELQRGAERNPPPADLTTSFLEYYRGGPVRADGSSWAFRVDVADSRITFRKGVDPEEEADVAIEIDFELVKVLAKTLVDDPGYGEMVQQAVADGRFVRRGTRESAGDWLNGVHDEVVRRTL